MYMCPHSLKDNYYSHECDIWSIGVTFYEMLIGNIPWTDKTEKELINQ